MNGGKVSNLLKNKNLKFYIDREKVSDIEQILYEVSSEEESYSSN
jgi:hypothetical protein